MPVNAIFIQHQKLLAWGLLIVLSLALIFLLIVPLTQWSLQLGQKIDTGYQQLSRFRQIANATPEMMKEYERVQQQGLDKLFYPSVLTYAQVAKELQTYLSDVITRNNGVLISSEVVDEQQARTQNETDEAAKNSVYQPVVVKALLQGSPSLLREVLHQAYQARPLIFVDSVDIKPVADDKSETQIVKVEVRISTYWRGAEVQHAETP